jgi:hypothetical protein
LCPVGGRIDLAASACSSGTRPVGLSGRRPIPPSLVDVRHTLLIVSGIGVLRIHDGSAPPSRGEGGREAHSRRLPMAVCARRAPRLCPAVLFVLACALIAGCAGGGANTGEPVAVQTYPDWVRMVPTATETSRYFVGGCSRAATLDGAIAVAAADVEKEVTSTERSRFLQLFDAALKDGRTETTPIERARFRNEGSEHYADAAAGTLECEHVFYDDCGDETDEDAVCSVFVLMRLDYAARDAALRKTLQEIRSEFRQEGNTSLAAVAERMERGIE